MVDREPDDLICWVDGCEQEVVTGGDEFPPYCEAHRYSLNE